MQSLTQTCRVEDFDRRGREPTQDEVTIYTWYSSSLFFTSFTFVIRKDATLRELTDLIKEVQPAARHRNAKLSFAFIYPDK
jgi:histone deacetylase complex subunit SAP18